MKLLRLSFAILWTITNLVVFVFLLGSSQKTGYCMEMYPPVCRDVIEYGWPNPWLNVEENSLTRIDEDNAHKIALVYALFLVPSLGVAWLTGKGLKSAHPRN